MHRSIRAIIVLALLLVLTAAGPLQETPPAPTSRAVIDSPAEGDVVAGLVTVTGTVVDPAFESYDLEYAPDPTLASVPWTPVQGTVTQQVSGGVLGAWDTTTLPDGRYVLRLRMNRRDDMPIEYEVRVVVANATPTPGPAIPADSPLRPARHAHARPLPHPADRAAANAHAAPGSRAGANADARPGHSRRLAAPPGPSHRRRPHRRAHRGRHVRPAGALRAGPRERARGAGRRLLARAPGGYQPAARRAAGPENHGKAEEPENTEIDAGQSGV